MKKKIIRQALKVSVKELRDLADELEKQHIEILVELGIKPKRSLIEKQGFQINIINKTPKCSDTWELEKVRK